MDESTRRKLDSLMVQEAVQSCRSCELHDHSTKPVPIAGAVPADYIILGLGPGNIENHKGIPFVGPAGRLIRTLLRKHGLDPESRAAFMNVVSCYPPNDRPQAHHIKACRWNFEAQLMSTCCDLIVACGGIALNSLIPRAELKWSRGSIIPIHGFRVLPIWHPAFTFHQKSAKPDIEVSLQSLKLVLDKGFPDDWLFPQCCIYCGKVLMVHGTPACKSHQKTWRQDKQWNKPTQLEML